MTKDEIRKVFVDNFWNGQFIEIHSGDVGDIIKLIYDKFQKNCLTSSINKQLIDDLNEVTIWYQGRNVDACERIEKFIKQLQNK